MRAFSFAAATIAVVILFSRTEAQQDEVCTYGEAKLTGKVGIQNYISSPLQILNSTPDTVTFSVRQVWKDEKLCAVATDYPDSNTTRICQRESHHLTGEIGTYTAVCVDGKAEVSIYAQGNSFNKIKDNAQWPKHCNPVSESSSRLAAYHFTLDCVPKHQHCVPQGDFACEKGGNLVLLNEDFENPEQIKGEWTRNFADKVTDYYTANLTSILGPIGKGKEIVARTLVVPHDGSFVKVEFDILSFGQWGPEDKVYFRIGTNFLLLGNFENKADKISGKFFKDGPVEKQIPVSVEHLISGEGPGFSKHRVYLTIPKFHAGSGRLEIGFQAKMSNPRRKVAAGFDNLLVTAICGDQSDETADISKPPCAASPSGGVDFYQ